MKPYERQARWPLIGLHRPAPRVQEDNDLLGRADQLNLHVHVTNASGTSPTITVKYWGSNDGKFWVTQYTLLNSATLTIGGIYDSMSDTGNTVLASLGKIEIQLGGTNPSAFVRITANGRTY